MSAIVNPNHTGRGGLTQPLVRLYYPINHSFHGGVIMVLTAAEKLKILATGKATLKELNELEKQAETESTQDEGSSVDSAGTSTATGDDSSSGEGTEEVEPKEEVKENPEVEKYKKELEEKEKQLAEKDEALKRAQLKAQHEDISDKTDYSDVALSNIIKGIR